MKRRKCIVSGSIKWRVFFGCTMMVAIILSFLWVFQTCFLDDFYKGIKHNEIRAIAQEISLQIDEKDLDERLETIAREQEICILITDETGFVLHSEEAWRNCVIHRMDSVLLTRAYYLTVQNGGTYLEQVDTAQALYGVDQVEQNLIIHRETLIYTTVSFTDDGAVRFILLNTNLTPVTATVETLRVQLIWITVIMVVLALALAVLLSLRISRPIRKINAAAKLLAHQQYDTHFSEEGYLEIRELAQTLNYAARELSKVEGLQRELVANISHDLRTPLTTIIGYAEIMRDLPGENTPENVQVIIDEATRLSSLVNDVLDISKLQSGTETMQVEIFDLTESIRSILARYEKMTDYTITLESEESVWVKGDPLKLSQVIYNLVNNAITYTGEDKSVTIRQTVDCNRVKITVIDTGEGIDATFLPDIWNRYYKVDKPHKRAQVGTGLGLSIVKSVLDLHPGTSYGVQSELGVGSQFWFEMEIQPAPLEDGEKQSER